MCGRPQDVSFTEADDHVEAIGDQPRIARDGVQYRLEVSRRPADDIQHFRSGRLLLQRLAQRGVALFQLVEQAHVLDRDDRLIRERLQKPKLLFTKRPRLVSEKLQYPDRLTLALDR